MIIKHAILYKYGEKEIHFVDRNQAWDFWMNEVARGIVCSLISWVNEE